MSEQDAAHIADAVSDELVGEILQGAVDLHCHSGPSVMPRRIDHIEALREASEAGVRALLIKDHYYSATPVTELLNTHFGHLGVELLSGVPLNNTSGGLNPYAVDHGLKLGARLVWMPTFSAANHIRHNRSKSMLKTRMQMLRPQALTVVDDYGDLKDEVKVILDQIAEFDAVLSAGHLHISEIWPLFHEAKKRGVKRLLVNHPTYVIDASLADIAELAAMGAFIEHSTCMFVPSRFTRFSADELRDVITAAGLEKTILGSDLGQIDNPTPVEGFRAVIRLCLSLGFDGAEVKQMVGGNARRLMGLDSECAPDPAGSGEPGDKKCRQD